jgi:hypothetical protein
VIAAILVGACILRGEAIASSIADITAGSQNKLTVATFKSETSGREDGPADLSET